VQAPKSKIVNAIIEKLTAVFIVFFILK